VQAVAEAHGGRVAIASGRGGAVGIWLPDGSSQAAQR
jgi:hypothetical protein